MIEMEALKWVLGILQLLVAAWCWHLYTGLEKANEANEKTSKELSSHKLHTSETFMTKSESTRSFDALSRTLETLISTMNNRFDRMDSKLDSKMDKGHIS